MSTMSLIDTSLATLDHIRENLELLRRAPPELQATLRQESLALSKALTITFTHVDDSFSQLQPSIASDTIELASDTIEPAREKPMRSEVGRHGTDDAEAYSMFPIQNRDATNWYYYCAQETQFWTAKELDFTKDRQEYATLKPRHKELYKDLLGFFQPADALVTQSSLRFIMEAERYIEQVFLIFQLAIEAVHAESYGLGVAAIIPEAKEQSSVYQMINTLDCVKAKAQFIKNLIDSDAPKNERLFAAAHAEGVFFVTLFSIIFYLRSKGKMKTFIFMNKQIAADETLHRDFFIEKVREVGLPTRERMVAIAEEAVKIEIEHLKYILREPIDSVEEDQLLGMTVENLSNYARSLSDQILVGVGSSPHFEVTADLPWMADLPTVKRPNFYEVQVNGYKRKALDDAMNWQSRIADVPTVATPVVPVSIVTNPDLEDF
jgi:ribonucleotide reductase beta subunit family protein with ferritin-like domain